MAEFFGLAYLLDGLLFYLLAQTGPNNGYESLALKATKYQRHPRIPQAMH